MSRIGKSPISIPSGVEVKLDESKVTVKGPKGLLSLNIHPGIYVEIDKGDSQTVRVKRIDNENQNRALHGLTRSLIFNMIEGVTKEFTKELEVNGVGYRVQKQGKNIVMNLGFSHQVIVSETDDVKLEVQGSNKIIVHGIDKQKVGQFAAEIREKRPPEPYKGKGIKYSDEVIIRKEGKAGKASKK